MGERKTPLYHHKQSHRTLMVSRHFGYFKSYYGRVGETVLKTANRNWKPSLSANASNNTGRVQVHDLKNYKLDPSTPSHIVHFLSSKIMVLIDISECDFMSFTIKVFYNYSDSMQPVNKGWTWVFWGIWEQKTLAVPSVALQPSFVL